MRTKSIRGVKMALILNSGTGSRMGKLTADKPKCPISLTNGATIIGRQLGILQEMGVTEFIITTGPFEEKIKAYLDKMFPELRIIYVHNPLYLQTNYIYSMLLAGELVRGDILLMHGDMIFDRKAIGKIFSVDCGDGVLVSPNAELPEKDFKAEIRNGRVWKVAVDIFGRHCVFLLPVYRLTEQTYKAWIEEIKKFEVRGELTVYAEHALNNLLDSISLRPVELYDELCMEIDDKEDLEKAKQILQKKEHSS